MPEPQYIEVWYAPARPALAREEGPVHAMLPRAAWGQAWCGQRAQFRHRSVPAVAKEVNCPKCVRALKRGRPYARGA